MGESYAWLGVEMVDESEISNFCFIHFRIVSFVTLKIIDNFKIKYRMFHKVSKLLLHLVGGVQACETPWREQTPALSGWGKKPRWF